MRVRWPIVNVLICAGFMLQEYSMDKCSNSAAVKIQLVKVVLAVTILQIVEMGVVRPTGSLVGEWVRSLAWDRTPYSSD